MKDWRKTPIGYEHKMTRVFVGFHPALDSLNDVDLNTALNNIIK